MGVLAAQTTYTYKHKGYDRTTADTIQAKFYPQNLADTGELEGKTGLKHQPMEVQCSPRTPGLVTYHFRLTANAVAAHPHVFALAGFHHEIFFHHAKGGLFVLVTSLKIIVYLAGQPLEPLVVCQ